MKNPRNTVFSSLERELLSDLSKRILGSKDIVRGRKVLTIVISHF